MLFRSIRLRGFDLITLYRSRPGPFSKSIRLPPLFDDEITSSPLLDCMWLLKVENIAQVITDLIHNVLKVHHRRPRAAVFREVSWSLES